MAEPASCIYGTCKQGKYICFMQLKEHQATVYYRLLLIILLFISFLLLDIPGKSLAHS